MISLARTAIRRLLLTCAVTAGMVLSGTLATAAHADTATRTAPMTAQASCWVNVFAWVSTTPSNQGNLSSIVSCGTTMRTISQTMYVHDYHTGAVVATVGPISQSNVMSGGISYSWFCSPFAPKARWGEVHGTVTEHSGAVSNGSWSTQVLSC